MITDRLYRLFPASQRNNLKRILRRLPSRTREVAFHSQRLEVDPTELSGFHLYYNREYDDEIFAFLERELKRYQRVLDIGANIGVYTCFFASRVAEVDAFEPVPEIAARLRRNLALNGHENVQVHEVCVSDAKGTINFDLPAGWNLGVGRISTGSSGNVVSRPCIPLDDVLASPRPVPTFVKMDIEGAEWMALRGGERALDSAQSRLSFLVEIHPAEITAYGGSVRVLFELFGRHGFSVSAITPEGLRMLQSPTDARFWWASNDR